MRRPALAGRAACVALLLLAALAGGCADGTAVRVAFAADPALSGGDPLAPRLASLQLLLDAEAGFEGLDAAAPPPGLRALDPDGDGASELLLELNVSGREALPVVRVDAGRNADRRIALQARGLDAAGQLVALGGLPARSLFVAGQVTEVTVPLNLARAWRPPHAVGASPLGVPPGFTLERVAFHVSRGLDAASLDGRVQVTLLLAGDAREPVAGGLDAPRSCAEGSQMWSFAPDDCHAAGPYLGVEIALAPGIADAEGGVLRDASGNEGAVLRLDVALAAFGPCAVSASCLTHGRQGTLQGSDALCDPASGRFGPAACTLLREACVDARDSPAWIAASSDAACQQLRPDSTLAEGGWCAVVDPWPCDHQWDCQPLGSSCNRMAQQCIPQPCEGSCADAELACAAAGCLPRVGTCVEDCRITGGCPLLGQACLVDEGGGARCR